MYLAGDCSVAQLFNTRLCTAVCGKRRVAVFLIHLSHILQDRNIYLCFVFNDTFSTLLFMIIMALEINKQTNKHKINKQTKN